MQEIPAVSAVRSVFSFRAIKIVLYLAGALLASACGAFADQPKAVKGDKALGEYLSSTCVTCHQISGKSTAGVPPIVGWDEESFVAVMKSYKDKIRENKVMQTLTAPLSDEDIAGLAAYFASIKPASE
ncbi:MAG: cytochrome c [Beijerinckiaceae bacterium]